MLDEEKTLAILEKVPLFKSLKKRQLSQLAKIFIDRQCEANEIIVPQGRAGYGFFIIAEGKAEAFIKHEDSSKIVVNTFGPADFFGEMALLDGGPRTATVLATEKTRCLILPRENFLGVMKRDGDMAVAIMIELAKRFRKVLNTL